VIIREMRAEEAVLVRDLWNEGCEAKDALVRGGWGRLSRESLERIRDNLARTPGCEDALCLVVEDDDGALVGFATASISRHPIAPGIVGEIEEVHVRPVDGAGAMARELALGAIAWTRSRGANVVVTYAAADAPWTDEEVRFWTALRFEIDRVVLHLYGPADGEAGDTQ
jgi:hypothetical protein